MTALTARTTVMVSLLCACGFAGGCFSAVSSRTIEPAGCAAHSDAVKQVIPGKTTAEWLLATMGKPTGKAPSPEGTEIYKYEYTETVRNQLHLLLLPGAEETVKTRKTLCFEVRDGVIQRCWRESAQLEKHSEIR